MEVEQPPLKDILSMIVNLLLAGMILQVGLLKKLLTTENLAHHRKKNMKLILFLLDEGPLKMHTLLVYFFSSRGLLSVVFSITLSMLS